MVPNKRQLLLTLVAIEIVAIFFLLFKIIFNKELLSYFTLIQCVWISDFYFNLCGSFFNFIFAFLFFVFVNSLSIIALYISGFFNHFKEAIKNKIFTIVFLCLTVIFFVSRIYRILDWSIIMHDEATMASLFYTKISNFTPFNPSSSSFPTIAMMNALNLKNFIETRYLSAVYGTFAAILMSLLLFKLTKKFLPSIIFMLILLFSFLFMRVNKSTLVESYTPFFLSIVLWLYFSWLEKSNAVFIYIIFIFLGIMLANAGLTFYFVLPFTLLLLYKSLVSKRTHFLHLICSLLIFFFISAPFFISVTDPSFKNWIEWRRRMLGENIVFNFQSLRFLRILAFDMFSTCTDSTIAHYALLISLLLIFINFYVKRGEIRDSGLIFFLTFFVIVIIFMFVSPILVASERNFLIPLIFFYFSIAYLLQVSKIIPLVIVTILIVTNSHCIIKAYMENAFSNVCDVVLEYSNSTFYADHVFYDIIKYSFFDKNISITPFDCRTPQEFEGLLKASKNNSIFVNDPNYEADTGVNVLALAKDIGITLVPLQKTCIGAPLYIIIK